MAFCKKLTDVEYRNNQLKDGWKYDLPSEVQWEYACRAGADTDFYYGNQIEDMDAYGWHVGNSFNVGEKYPHKVVQKKANAWGLYDMHGNVCEWCLDQSDPTLFVPGRVTRGGLWLQHAHYSRFTSSPGIDHEQSRSPAIGFRVALVRSK